MTQALHLHSADHMVRVGVTGGIGAGKSAVCSVFSRLGAPVLDADNIAKERMREDVDLKRELVALLGPRAYRPDSDLDRKYIASKIFSSSGLHHKVNAVVHPRVEAEIAKRLLRLERAGKRLAIVEAALIYEAAFERVLDYVIVVDSPESERIKRVAHRDGVSPKDVQRRIRSQHSPASKIRRADYVIRNNGSLHELESSVRFLYSILLTIAGKQ